MSRYTRTEIEIDDSEYYKSLRRGKKTLAYYATPSFTNPSVAQRVRTTTTSHIWKYGDRFYKLANDYYGDVRFWWVIAWWNGTPTEANLYNGAVIRIPVDIQEALKVLGA